MIQKQSELVKPRMEWLDALRGFAILLVIFYHMDDLVFGKYTSITPVLQVIRMPLFFFISGYLSFTPFLTKELFYKRVSNRWRKQLLPTVFIWFAFIVITFVFSAHDFAIAGFIQRVLQSIEDPLKSGYWFTLSIVEIFIIYICIARICCHLKLSLRTIGVIFLLGAILCFPLSRLMFVTREYQPLWFIKLYKILSLERTFSLGGYFFFGAFCRLNQKAFEQAISKKFFIPLSLVVFGFLYMKYGSMTTMYRICGFIGVLIPISLFWNMKDRISSESKFWGFWVNAGKNTLPVYLTHYFLIFILTENFIVNTALGLHPLKAYVGNDVTQLCAGIAVSMLILWLTLIGDKYFRRWQQPYRLIYGV